ncbi:MAG TPA: response regulator, partial [Polyangiaceae bacterium]|nr:response regulator [Polyangiaceae bacterium]
MSDTLADLSGSDTGGLGSEPQHVVEDENGEATAPGDEITVLVVDDEAGNTASLQKIFERENMRVFVADGAKQALELVRHRRIQVVLTDLMMPG